jgi:hypothetical protein
MASASILSIEPISKGWITSQISFLEDRMILGCEIGAIVLVSRRTFRHNANIKGNARQKAFP